MSKASQDDGIPADLLIILKDYKSAALNMPAYLENSAVATGLEKVSFHQSQRQAMPKNAQTTVQLCLCHILARLCSKYFKLGSISM